MRASAPPRRRRRHGSAWSSCRLTRCRRPTSWTRSAHASAGRRPQLSARRWCCCRLRSPRSDVPGFAGLTTPCGQPRVSTARCPASGQHDEWRQRLTPGPRRVGAPGTSIMTFTWLPVDLAARWRCGPRPATSARSPEDLCRHAWRQPRWTDDADRSTIIAAAQRRRANHLARSPPRPQETPRHGAGAEALQTFRLAV